MTKCQHCDAEVLSTSQPNRMGTTDEGARLSNWLADYSHDLMEDGDLDQEAAEIVKASKWIADRLAQPATPAVGGEAVAWRSRHSSRIWVYHEDKLTGPSAHLFETQPLYAALPASPLRGREELKRAFEGGFWAWFGPSNNRELDKGLCELERCWTEYEAEFLSASPPEQPAADQVTGRDSVFDLCVMIVEEECILDKPPAQDDEYERGMHEVGLAIRDRIKCAQRNPEPKRKSPA